MNLGLTNELNNKSPFDDWYSLPLIRKVLARISQNIFSDSHDKNANNNN